MGTDFPYIVSVICAAIAVFAGYAVVRKQAEAETQKLLKQYEPDMI